MHYKSDKIKNNILLFIELQLLISILLLPIFVAWGLPISIMSIIGNFLFAPFLTLFISCSTLLLITELLHIPNQLIITILNIITHTWTSILNIGSKQWLIGFQESLLYIITLSSCAIFLIYTFKTLTQKYRLALLIIVHTLPFAAKASIDQYTSSHEIFQGKQKVEIVRRNKKIYLIDYGALGSKKSYASWIDFTLTPFLIQKLGATHIDTFISCKTNPQTRQAINYLKRSIPIKHHIQITSTYN